MAFSWLWAFTTNSVELTRHLDCIFSLSMFDQRLIDLPWRKFSRRRPLLSLEWVGRSIKWNYAFVFYEISSNLSSLWNWTAILKMYIVYHLPLSKEKRMAIAGVIFGLLGIFSVISYAGLPGIIIALIGLFLTYRARSNAASNQMLVKIGLLLNGFFLLMSLYYQFNWIN